jgi:hypothetical protein
VQTQVYAAMDKGASDEVKKIIAANSGTPGKSAHSGKASF